MIRQHSIKKCRGIGKAKGFGCGNTKEMHKYNLCKECLKDFIFNSDQGKEILEKSKIRAKVKTDKQIKSETRKKKSELKKFNLYTSTAWKWISRYVLLYYSDSNCIVQCSTSPEQSYHITDRRIHVGHLIPWRDGNSTNNSTALLFENLAPQNHVDNTMHGGKPEIMKEWLIERHGWIKIENLYKLKSKPLKLDKYLLFEISEQYKKKFKSLLESRGIEDPWKH